jgi:hypothetical protein
VAETNIDQPLANSVTAVYGTWIVPYVTAPSGSGSTNTWVGIDGHRNDTVEQVGTDEFVRNGIAIYGAWWEMWSSGKQQPNQIITSMQVEPGDSITGSVQYMTSGPNAGEFVLAIVDNSRPNDSFSIDVTSSQYQSPLAERMSAEWIVEAASNLSDQIQTPSDFSKVKFTNASAVIGGVAGPIGTAAWQSQPLNLVSNGVTYYTTSGLTGSGSTFVVTDDLAAPAVPPVVLSIQPITSGKTESLVIRFSEAMYELTIFDAKAYLLGIPGRGKKGKSKNVPVVVSSYNNGTDSMTLLLLRRIKPAQRLQVTLFGSGPDELVSASGLPLDGNQDGQPGGNSSFVLKFPKSGKPS